MATQGKDDRPRLNDIPDFYIYKEAGKVMRTNKNLTKEINTAIFRRSSTFDTCGRTFYPQWTEPNFLTQQRAAWKISQDGLRIARWTWKTQTHDRTHRACHLLKDGKCAVRVIRRVGWDPKIRLWTLDKVEDQPTEDEMRQLDAKL